MDPILLLLLLFAFALLGVLAGSVTGLLPGLHVNNVALIVLGAQPLLLAGLAAFAPGDVTLLLSAFLAAASVTHGFLSLLPSVFLGAPEADTALSVLPGHRLLALGRGQEAVLFGARGAFLAVLVALPLLLPVRLLLGPPVGGYDRLTPIMPFLLLLLVTILIATEGRGADARRAWRKRGWALALILLAGLLGWIVLRAGFLRDAWAPLRLGSDSLILFPLFTGLFGLPTLLLSAGHRGRLPPQVLGPPEPLAPWRHTRGLLSGTLAGAAVSWFPGLGGSNATVIAQLLAGGEPKEGDPDADREFLLAVGAAGSSTAIFTFVALFVIQRARSGVAAAVDAMAGSAPPWDPVGGFPALLAAVLLAVVLAAALGYVLVVRLSRPFVRLAGRVRYGRLASSVAAALALGVFLVAGPLGLLVLFTATSLGLVPALLGVRRVHLMGCLLVPLLLGGA